MTSQLKKKKSLCYSPKHCYYSVQSCILMKPCCLIPYLLLFGYFFRTPDNSNFFRFPLKVQVIGCELYLKYGKKCSKHTEIFVCLIQGVCLIPVSLYYLFVKINKFVLTLSSNDFPRSSQSFWSRRVFGCWCGM